MINVINLVRMVGSNYCPPNWNIICGELLDLNWKSYRTKTTKDMMSEADIFGLLLLRDCQKAKAVITALVEMVHQKPPTPVSTKNTATNSIVNRMAK